MFQSFVILGGVLAFLAVALGAFGAHALKARLTSERLAVFQTGVQYQMYHALGLVGVALISLKIQQSVWLTSAGWCFVVGILLFSGSLYALCLTNRRKFGAITPIGGLSFLLGWMFVVVAACAR